MLKLCMATIIASWQLLLLVVIMCNLALPAECTVVEQDFRERTDRNDLGFNSGLDIQVHPSQTLNLTVDQEAQVSIRATVRTANYSARQHAEHSSFTPNSTLPLIMDYNYTYIARIESGNKQVAVPEIPSRNGIRTYPPHVNGSLNQVTLYLDLTKSNSFTIHAKKLGSAVFFIQVSRIYDGHISENNTFASSSSFDVILQYHVTVIRHLRLVDIVFNWVVAVIAGLNSFSLGCATSVTSLQTHLRQPTAVLLALLCQIIILPTVSMPDKAQTSAII